MYQLTYHYATSVLEERRAEAAEFRRRSALPGPLEGRRYFRRDRSQARH